MEEKKYPMQKKREKHPLKLERERRGWSLGYMAMRIDCPDPHTVGRWERGTSLPSPRYRQALCELFGKDAHELGFLKSELDGECEEALDQVHWEQKLTRAFPAHSEMCFFFNVKLPYANELYGRKIEREILLNRIYNKSSTSLVGPRRIGKTWLLEYLLLEAGRQLGHRFRVGYLDTMMASCSTIAGFTARASRELGCPLPPECVGQGLVALEEVVETLRENGLHAVLCIDEFEGFGNRQEFDLNFFASLRALAQGGLSLVIASRRPLIDIVGNYSSSSDFFNVFEQLTLEPFDSEEAEEFVTAKSSCAGFTDQEQARLLQYGQLADAQWSPIRLQLVGKMLFEDKTLHVKRDAPRYRPDDPDYWQHFVERLERKYRGVIVR